MESDQAAYASDDNNMTLSRQLVPIQENLDADDETDTDSDIDIPVRSRRNSKQNNTSLRVPLSRTISAGGLRKPGERKRSCSDIIPLTGPQESEILYTGGHRNKLPTIIRSKSLPGRLEKFETVKVQNTSKSATERLQLPMLNGLKLRNDINEEDRKTGKSLRLLPKVQQNGKLNSYSNRNGITKETDDIKKLNAVLKKMF